MDLLTGAGLAAPAGLNAYIPLLTIGLLDRYTNLVNLASPYDILSSDTGLIVLAILLVIELFADAIPGIDSVNDLVQTIIRPATGVLVMFAFEGSAIDMHPVVQSLIGGGLAGVVHTVKAVSRPIVTVTTAGLGNAGVSTAENVLALVLSILAILIPIAVVVLVALLIVLMAGWLIKRRSARHSG